MKAFLTLCALVFFSVNVYAAEEQMTRLDLANAILNVQKNIKGDYLTCSTALEDVKGDAVQCKIDGTLSGTQDEAKDKCINAVFSTVYKAWIAKKYAGKEDRGKILSYTTTIMNDEGVKNLKKYIKAFDSRSMVPTKGTFRNCFFSLDNVDATLGAIVVKPKMVTNTSGQSVAGKSGTIRMTAVTTYSDGSEGVADVSFNYPADHVDMFSIEARPDLNTSGCKVTITNEGTNNKITDVNNPNKTVSSIYFYRNKYYSNPSSSVLCSRDITFSNLTYGLSTNPKEGSVLKLKASNTGEDWNVADQRTIILDSNYPKDYIIAKATAAAVTNITTKTRN